MEAIEFKVGNGKGVERIASIINSINNYQVSLTKFREVDYIFGVSGISDYDFGTLANTLAMEVIAFLDDIRKGVIDDGDIFDHINESGDVGFMDDINKVLRECDTYTIKYLYHS